MPLNTRLQIYNRIGLLYFFFPISDALSANRSSPRVTSPSGIRVITLNAWRLDSVSEKVQWLATFLPLAVSDLWGASLWQISHLQWSPHLWEGLPPRGSRVLCVWRPDPGPGLQRGGGGHVREGLQRAYLHLALLRLRQADPPRWGDIIKYSRKMSENGNKTQFLIHAACCCHLGNDLSWWISMIRITMLTRCCCVTLPWCHIGQSVTRVTFCHMLQIVTRPWWSERPDSITTVSDVSRAGQLKCIFEIFFLIKSIISGRGLMEKWWLLTRRIDRTAVNVMTSEFYWVDVTLRKLIKWDSEGC